MLEELTSARYPRLLARARSLVMSQVEAEDLVQEALVATFSRHRGFASVAEAEQYVRRAIVTSFLDQANKAKREKDRWQRAQALAVTGVDDHASSIERALDVSAVVRELAPRERACVVLRFMEDLSIRETAHALGLSEGAVKRYTADGIARLNALLGTAEALEPDDHAPVSADQRGGRR